MEQERYERSSKTKKKRKKKPFWKTCLIGCFGFLLILLIGAGVVGFFAYQDVQETTEQMYEPVEDKVEMRDSPVDIENEQEPFSVLLMGIDTGGEGRTDTGRSDTMMVLTVNPNTNSTSITSIPRDTLVEMAGAGYQDKINHAYSLGGPSMSMNTVQNFFNIPIDYYVSVNMQGLEQIIDTIGGITVTPSMTFTHSGYQFVENQPTNMDGNMALEYSRMRYEDPAGDYGRQARQRQVVQAIIDEIASLSSIGNFSGILDVLGTNVLTNMTFSEMQTVFSEYRSAAGDSANQVQLQGEGQMINGVYYAVVPESERNRVSSILQSELEM